MSASDIAQFSNTVWQDALMVARDNNLMTNLVTVFGDRSGTALRSLQLYGTATINAITDKDDLTSQTFSPSQDTTLTPTEAGGQFFVTDTRLETDPFAVRQDAALELGMATAQKIETDLLSTFSSLTGGTVGTSGSAFTWSYFYAMLSRLRAQNAPFPYTLVLHPYQWHPLGKAVAPGATVTNSPAIQDAVLRQFYVGSVSGVDIFTSANLPLSSTDAKPAMFSRAAIALDVRRAPRMEPERDSSRRGWELNMTTIYAAGVWRRKFGIQGIFDCQAPTI